MLKKLNLAIFYASAAYVLYIYGDVILTWLRQADNVPIVILLAALTALFPVVPYPVVSGIIGAALGPALGGIAAWAGSTAASIIMFLYIRYGYREWGVRVLHRYSRIGKLTALFERNAFLSILFARLIPFIPSIAINIYAALSRVSFASYAVASSIGKMPAMLLFVTVGDNFVSNPKTMLAAIGVYGLFLALSLYAYRLWRGKHLAKL